MIACYYNMEFKQTQICIESLNYFNKDDFYKIKLIKKIFGNACNVKFIADNDGDLHTNIDIDCKVCDLDLIEQILDNLHID